MTSRTGTVVGALLLLAAAAVVLVPVLRDTLVYVHLWTALALGVVGGLLVQPQTFREIAADLIDNLPGGDK